MIVLSLFDGMSCGQIALERTGIKVDKYYASEIDKYAIQITQKNYPDTIQLGDITKWREWNIEQPDLIIGGSPCQGFSFAGKQLNFDDPRSKLFFTFVDILKHYNPKYYLLENVRMKIDYERIITEQMWCYPVMIDSSLVSAQSRKRLYWTNIGAKSFDLFGNIISGIEQPEDKGLLIKDILESEVDEKYYLSEKLQKTIIGWEEKQKAKGNTFKPNIFEKNSSEKSGAIKSTYHKVQGDGTYIVHNLQPRQGKGIGGKGHIQKEDGKTYCLDVGNAQAVEIVAMRGRGDDNEQQIEPRTNGKSNSLTGVQKDNLILHTAYSGHDDGKPRVYSEKSPSITTPSGGGHIPFTSNGIHIRRLTPVECERLQTVDDNYTEYGLDIRFQKFYNGNEWRVQCKQYAESKNVINQSQAGKLNSVINTILDLSELERLKDQESLLIKAESVFLKDVTTNSKQLRVIASSIIKSGNEVNQLINQKNVRFAIIQSGLDHVECVLSITIPGEETVILYKQKIENTNLTEIQIENTIKIKTVNGFIKLLLKKYLKENSKKAKLFITLILINLIILKAIFMSANLTQLTYVYMDSLIKSQENSLNLELLSLEMGFITKTSDSVRYRCLGNGWTVDVISHIFKYIRGDNE